MWRVWTNGVCRRFNLKDLESTKLRLKNHDPDYFQMFPDLNPTNQINPTLPNKQAENIKHVSGAEY